ncbi:uncharacterized protein L3040_005807 [Drepanopeziza brunnea f. sp. 'multigermtubi']|uniref:Transcription factor TFIIIC triple barrel domain-containing protein n=1 Tax=Marssonina brunnea f. sp. multigermtubi (strain MB_m1) TaxID=1072389 RepID=K1W7A8_MARBU|nr:uncharacterized protein MBM_08904 [Drepanopeziza brunnea f. sp. 'multigermtubi' MB_m1]EKD12950.1 hypothetical protein MBM_08904 [Drepanopeziza brunnea f. sp. 'multigermtubi' MB_m1]KAJ5041259.1 hypothetical protein L3040_005807 [Drepanopeziza brunnea f. sp. 'multigermtubi']
MYEFRAPFPAPSNDPPPNDPSSFSNPIAEPENEDEWEYEYSATETETFYVTLDLTTPDVPGQPRQLVYRDAKKQRYTLPGMGKHKQKVRLPEDHLRGAPVYMIEEEDDGDAEPAPENNEGEEEADTTANRQNTSSNAGAEKDRGANSHSTTNSHPPSAGRAETETLAKPQHSAVTGAGSPPLPTENDEEEADRNPSRFRPLLKRRPDSPPRPIVKPEPPRPTDVQILDIHTTKPLVSYNGHVYVCRWSENIGTELLFMSHDPTNSLPKLRSLGDDCSVDLLAASSARIVSTSVRLQKHGVDQQKAKYGARKVKPKIPRGQSEARNTQAAFLEQFIEVKEEAGEEDNVTVHVQKRLTNSKWRAQMMELRVMERENLSEIIHGERSKAMSEEEIGRARERLAEMDEEDEEMRKAEEGEGPDRRFRKRKAKANANPEDPGTAKKPRGIDWGKSTLPLGDFLNREDGDAQSVGTPTVDGESVAAGSPRQIDDGDEDGEEGDFASMYRYEQYGSPEGMRFEQDESDEDDLGAEDDY